MKKTLLIIFGMFALSVQADLIAVQHTHYQSGEGVKSEDSANLMCKGMIAMAEAENKKAGKVGFEWRDTAGLIKKAKKVGGKKCIELAGKAKSQAISAQQQAKDQANAGPKF